MNACNSYTWAVLHIFARAHNHTRSQSENNVCKLYDDTLAINAFIAEFFFSSIKLNPSFHSSCFFSLVSFGNKAFQIVRIKVVLKNGTRKAIERIYTTAEKKSKSNDDKN